MITNGRYFEMNLHVKNVLHMCMIFMLFLLMRASNIIAKNKELESSPLLRFTTLDQIVSKGFVKVPTLTPRNKPRFSLPPTNKNLALQKFCKNVDREKKKLRWKGFDCHKVQWEADWITKDGYPLVYKVFGKGRNKTLILGGVHSDELTPTQLSFLLIQYLIDNPSSYEGTDYQIMIAPLVNPDGFFGNGYLRTNGLVDLNRNLPTLDWNTHAVKKWRRGGSSHRKFPGYVSNSEIETEFQIDLIKEFQPDKILSIHSPLGFLDFDGPKENHHHSDTLIKSISGIRGTIGGCEDENLTPLDIVKFAAGFGSWIIDLAS